MRVTIQRLEGNSRRRIRILRTRVQVPVQGTSNTVANDGKPTIYLIAFKDHRIIEALGYWTEGTMLHYVTVEYALNHASITLIDPDLSMRLNHERGIEFKLTSLD